MTMKTANGPKCDHSIVHLNTGKKAHVMACTKCHKYFPDPHPSLSKRDVARLIEQIPSPEQFKKMALIAKKQARNPDVDLL